MGIYNKFEYTRARSCANVSTINCATKMKSMLQYSRKTEKLHTNCPKATSPSEHRLTKMHAITTKVRRTPTHTAVRVKRTLNDHGRSAKPLQGEHTGAMCGAGTKGARRDWDARESYPIRARSSKRN